MDFIKFLGLYWYYVVIVVALVAVFLGWGKKAINQHLDRRHREKILEIQTRASMLPYGNTLTEAEQIIMLNRGAEVLENLVLEAQSDVVMDITLKPQLQEARKYLSDLDKGDLSSYQTKTERAANADRARRQQARTMQGEQ
jgi:hypothetical protein